MSVLYTYPTQRDIRSSLRRTVEPSGLPYTLAEAKRALDVGDQTDASLDTEIQELIAPAVAMVENDSQRALMPQTWQLKLDSFPDIIELRRPPVTAVSSVTYVDEDGTSQTLAASSYTTDLTSAPALIAREDTWPPTDERPAAVSVTFTAGYAGEIPREAWAAIGLALQSLYNGCEAGDAYWCQIGRLQWSGRL